MSHAPKSQALRYITRMNYARTSGWWVRFYAGTTLLAGKLFPTRKAMELHMQTNVAR